MPAQCPKGGIGGCAHTRDAMNYQSVRRPGQGRRTTWRAAIGAVLLAVAAFGLAAAAPAAQAAGRCGEHPWCNTALSPDARAGLLLDALTSDEKVSLLGGDEPFGVGGGAPPPPGTRAGVPRLDLPNVYFSDGPVGPRQGSATAMPVPMALAATFDPRLAVQH